MLDSILPRLTQACRQLFFRKQEEEAQARRLEALFAHNLREGHYVRVRSTFWLTGYVHALVDADVVVVDWSDGGRSAYPVKDLSVLPNVRR